MGQIDQDLYFTIATSYAAIDVSLSTVSTNARAALDAIVDVSTATYPNPSQAAEQPDLALEIELALLSPFNNAYVGSKSLANSVGSLLDAIRSVNNHVINNSVFSGTATQKLDDFVNNTMRAWWDDNTVPVGWKNLCSDAGYTVTAWT